MKKKKLKKKRKDNKNNKYGEGKMTSKSKIEMEIQTANPAALYAFICCQPEKEFHSSSCSSCLSSFSLLEPLSYMRGEGSG